MDDLTDRFIAALHRLHTDSEPDELVELFADDATLSKGGLPHVEHGEDGARTFWQDYRDVFDDVEATFTRRIDGDEAVALEWTSRGTLRDGQPIEYDGVSVLEGDGTRIQAFRTYYDTAAFIRDSER